MPLARLARLLWLALALWVLGAVAWGALRGRPGLAIGLVMLPLAGHALVLALEMALARWAARAQALKTASAPFASPLPAAPHRPSAPPAPGLSDSSGPPPPPPPPPRLHHWLRAWAGEWGAALRVFGWQQPWRHLAEPDHLPDGARSRRGVVLIHGFVCNRAFWNRWLRGLRRQGVPVVAVDLGPVFAPIEALVPALEQAVARVEACTGLPPVVVVAHSMGGLVLRCWWGAHGQDDRVHRALTLGTPHHGTLLARWAFTGNTRQMRPHGAWLRALAAAEPPARRARLVCFQAACDNVVFPEALARLDGADNRRLEGRAHVDMVDAPAVWLALQDLLDAPDRARPGEGPRAPSAPQSAR
jgi:triacylglycerol lipase